jgi:hypothetical protein
MRSHLLEEKEFNLTKTTGNGGYKIRTQTTFKPLELTALHAYYETAMLLYLSLGVDGGFNMI